MTTQDAFIMMGIGFLLFAATAGIVPNWVPFLIAMVYSGIIAKDYIKSRTKNDDKNNKST